MLGSHLSCEVAGLLGRVVLCIGRNVPTSNILDGNVLDVEPDIVTRDGLCKRLVVHLNGLHLSGQIVGGEGDNITGLQNTSLHTANRYCPNTWER